MDPICCALNETRIPWLRALRVVSSRDALKTQLSRAPGEAPLNHLNSCLALNTCRARAFFHNIWTFNFDNFSCCSRRTESPTTCWAYTASWQTASEFSLRALQLATQSTAASAAQSTKVNRCCRAASAGSARELAQASCCCCC